MIAVATNVLARYLLNDEVEQARLPPACSAGGKASTFRCAFGLSLSRFCKSTTVAKRISTYCKKLSPRAKRPEVICRDRLYSGDLVERWLGPQKQLSLSAMTGRPDAF